MDNLNNFIPKDKGDTKAVERLLECPPEKILPRLVVMQVPWLSLFGQPPTGLSLMSYPKKIM